MCNAQMTTGFPWLVGLVLVCNPMGARAQVPQLWGPNGHENSTQVLWGPIAQRTNTQVGWGPIGHGNNEHSVPGVNGLGTLGDPDVEATLGPIAHGANEHPVPGLNRLGTEDDVAIEAAWGPGVFSHLLAVPGARSVAPEAGGNLLPDAPDLLPRQAMMAPLSGAPRAGAVPAPGAAALLALAALGAGRRRRRG